MTPLYATPSDVLTYPKVSTKTLVYRPSQEASCGQINFCLLSMPHMFYIPIIIQAFYIFRPPIEWKNFYCEKNGASVIHGNEQQSQNKTRENADQTRKCCLETFGETSRRTPETNNEEYTKKGQSRVEVRQKSTFGKKLKTNYN